MRDKTKHTAGRRDLVALTVAALTYLCLISSVSAAPLLAIEVNNTTTGEYESLTILNPGDGNWVEMVGGDEVRLPPIKLVFDCTSRKYVKGDKNVTLNVYGAPPAPVNYPFFECHQYYESDAVSVHANILGEDTIADFTTYAYLVKTSPGEMNRVWNSTFAGDLKPLRDLLDNCVATQTVTLNSTGDYTEEVDFGKLAPGDYLVITTLNESTAQNITLISAAAFEVLEYKSTLNVTKIDEMYVEGTLTINATVPHTYNYVAALIGKDEAFDLRLDCEGTETELTKSELNLKLRGVTASESINVLGGSGLQKLTPCILYDWLLTFKTVSVEKGEGGTTYNFSLPVMDMPYDVYYLYVMSCNASALTFAFALPPPPAIIIPPLPCTNCFEVNITYKKYLKPGKVSDPLLTMFTNNSISMSSSARISRINETTWSIVDDKNFYIIIIGATGEEIAICRPSPPVPIPPRPGGGGGPSPTPSPTPTPTTHPYPHSTVPCPTPTLTPTPTPEYPVVIPTPPFAPGAPVEPQRSALLGVPLLGAMLFPLFLLTARKRDVVDFGVFTPEEIAILDRTVYIPVGVKLGRILPGGATAAIPNRKLARELREQFDIPLNTADAIAIAIERGARLFTSDPRYLGVALSLGVEAYLRPKIISEDISNNRNVCV